MGIAVVKAVLSTARSKKQLFGAWAGETWVAMAPLCTMRSCGALVGPFLLRASRPTWGWHVAHVPHTTLVRRDPPPTLALPRVAVGAP